MPNSQRPRTVRRSTIENLEERQVMTADLLAGALEAPLMKHGFDDNIPDLVQHDTIPVMHQHDELPSIVHHGDRDADFILDYGPDNEPGEVGQHLDDAHSLTGLDDVRADYGFTGVGQTVVVIDSGIAFDHYALGGGFGADYRVVGGWDFTEDDANPYDDGPEGSHGTHVAGIIGGTGDLSGNDEGVAPGVDLIGLRVFDDAGYGSFSDVSNALQWVIDNYNAFENPITAVNLSLGTSWNASTPPVWASFLESRFQQIEALGIFISVSAGNSFTSYNTPGLSYPAASSYVVPVMSVDDSGSMSYFSQRHNKAIAAPGRGVRSTIPDYAGNNNGQADDWASFSGTSMAAPYVAGASVLVRQAMDLMGHTNITQDTIYDHMRATADSFFDSATSQSYLRLNLSAAIDSLLPDDDYGSTAGTAHDLGNLLGDAEVGGMISSLSDADYFTFTAGASGVATFTATDTHQLDVDWDFGGQSATQNGSSWEMNVVAGQTYTVGISTSDGLGYYDMNVSVESAFSYVDWGNIGGQQSHNSIANGGEQWYRVVADRAGYVTAQAAFAHAAGNVDIALYDAAMQMVGQSAGTSDAERVEWIASAGDEFYFLVSGTNADIDFQLTNMVTVNGTTVDVMGTSGDDTFEFTAGSTHTLSVNDVTYEFSAETVTIISVNGGGGFDTTTLTGGAGNDTATLRVGHVSITDMTYTAVATGMESVTVEASGGDDVAILYDSVGDDSLVAYSDSVLLSGAGFSHEVRNFAETVTYASGGNDQAIIYDTTHDDTLTSWSDRVIMYGDGYWNDVNDFDHVVAHASIGNDRAVLRDSAGDDTYTTWWNRAIMYGNGYWNDVRGFDSTLGIASSGNDKAVHRDSAGNDAYTTWWNRAIMYGNGYWNDARGFDSTYGFASTGNDKAVFRDSNGNDTFTTWWNRAVMYGNGYWNDSRGFDSMLGLASSGDDVAVVRDSNGDDVLSAWSDRVVLEGNGFAIDARDFAETRAYASGGHDTAYFYDTIGDDVYTSWSDRAVMYGDGYWNDTFGFEQTHATSISGNDRAVMRDSAGHDEVHASGSTVYITDGATYRHEVQGFGQVDVVDDDGDGTDEAFIGAVDEIFNLLGEWTLVS